MFTRKLTRPLAIGAAALAVSGGAYGIVSATASTGSGSAATTSPPVASTARRPPGVGGSNARSGPAAGGTAGTVESVSRSSFTVLTAAGQKATIETTSATGYETTTSSSSARTVQSGAHVLVLGTTSGTTITATEVVTGAAGAGSTGTSSSSGVVPFQRGAQSTSKQVGQIPAAYNEGSGTIVSGTAANDATRAALTAYPGGIVDRVVELSNGEYEVHDVGVNWPHHIFVNRNYEVVGAD
jgi:Domain of unknown function (DUF5666)